MGVQPKLGGKFLLKLNIGERPIANKYREGKMQRTLKRELKVLEIAKREAIGTSGCPLSIQPSLVHHGGDRRDPLWSPCRYRRCVSDGALRQGTCQHRLGEWDIGRWKVGCQWVRLLVFVIAAYRYHFHPIEVPNRQFWAPLNGMGNEVAGCCRLLGQLAVPVDRWYPHGFIRTLGRDADEMVLIDPSCNTDQGV